MNMPEQTLVFPQSEWDTLCGVIMAYSKGDIPVARGYLDNHGADKLSAHY
ncbi:MAG: hypothetical protein ABR542_04190 [Desulfonatronovibrio sp.]